MLATNNKALLATRSVAKGLRPFGAPKEPLILSSERGTSERAKGASRLAEGEVAEGNPSLHSEAVLRCGATP